MDKKTVIYIHGFGSSGFGGKAMLFREYFKKDGVPFLAPSLSYVPRLAIETLKEIASQCANPCFIGSSLGGFYALYLATYFNTRAVLINPALYASSTLKRHIKGYATNYYDCSKFEWNDTHLAMLKEYVVDKPNAKNIMMLLQSGDEIIDHQESMALLPEATTFLEEGGTHAFEGIERHFESVAKFLLQ